MAYIRNAYVRMVFAQNQTTNSQTSLASSTLYSNHINMETRKGLFTKLGIFGAVAISLFLVGKTHIAAYKEKRHRLETDARIDSEENEFGITSRRPGFPTNNPTLSYEGQGRTSKYEGTGNSYATRRGGDRFNMKAIFDKSWDDKPKD